MPHDDEPISNRSNNPYLNELATAAPARRRFLHQAAAAAFIAGAPMVVRDTLGLAHAAPPSAGEVGPISFASVGITTADTVTVPDGYTARVLYAWGDPISDGPAFKQDASNSADEQALQAGMHHDGMHFFPFVARGAAGAMSLSSVHGLLVVNHEYVDDGLLHVGGQAPWTAEKVRKAQNAHGVSVVEIEQRDRTWSVRRPSVYARRVTAASPIAVSGPAAGHALLKTAADPTGARVLGTINNCAHGFTPWGTYLTCEENFNGYFINDPGGPGPLRHREDRFRLSLVGVRRALRRRCASQRAESLRLGRRDRSLGALAHADEADGARPHEARGRDAIGRARRSTGRVPGR